MAHDFPVPDEVRLERLIISVYKRMPEPEFHRLNRIEDRLARALPPTKSRHKVNTIPWWIVILLTGGLATAAWWVSNIYNDSMRIRDNQTMEMNDEIMQHAETPVQQGLPLEQHKPDDLSSDTQDLRESPVIYLREQ